MSTEPVETFVFLPYSKYKALDNRSKKVEEPNETTNAHKEFPMEVAPMSPPTVSETSKDQEKKEEVKHPLGKNVTQSYRNVQIKKLLHQIEKAQGSVEVTSLPNLDDLIKAALSSSRKKVLNEEVFFTFLFDNGLGHFVKNRSKIDLYYKHGPWYQV